MAAEIKKNTALLRGIITGMTVTRVVGSSDQSTPVFMVVRDKDDREFRLGLVVTGTSHRLSGTKILCDFAGVVRFVSGTGGERLKGALIQGTIDLACALMVSDHQGRLECLRPLLAEAA
jgi:hypothetical protein